MTHHFLQCLEPAVMHVGSSPRDVAQGRRHELAPIGITTGDAGPTGIAGFEIQSIVVKLVIGEEHPAMAVEAVGPTLPHTRFVLGHEEFQPPAFQIAEAGRSLNRPIKPGPEPGEGQDKLFQRQRDAFGVDARSPKRFFEQGRILGHSRQFANHRLQGLGHLRRILDGY